MTFPPAGRILMTTDAVGGVWTYATALACGLCARGHEVVLVTMGPAPCREQLQQLRHIHGLSAEITDLALEWMDPDGSDTRAADVLWSIAQRTRPDIVHLNSYREAALPWQAAVLVVAHSCVWSWWEACRGTSPDEPRWQRYAAAVCSGLQAADAWAAPTAAFVRSIETRCRPAARGRVISNGIDLPASFWRKEPLILAAGRLWDEAKNLAALDRIAAGLDWPVRAAGPMQEPGGEMRQPLRGVHHLGALSHAQLMDEMQRASIFVSPALYEPFGLSVLEAAACGCALVLSDIPSLRELWVGAALFVEARDPAALAAALRRLSRDDALRARLQQAARRRARRYRLDAMVEAYEELYGAILERSPPKHQAPRIVALAGCQA
jgi:glycosyltransferase involved in cell wall biosynthesis